MKDIKQVIIVRADLNMRRGKESAQIAHASMKIFFDRMWKWSWKSEEDCIYCLYETDCKCQNWNDDMVHPKSNPCASYETNIFKTKFRTVMNLWAFDPNYIFKKVVVSCNSEKELLDLHKQAEEAHIVNSLILDSGLTEFKNDCDFCEGFGKIIIQEPGHAQNVPSICPECKGKGKVNKPTHTCLAIGPDYSEKIDKITGHLKLR